MALQFTRNAKIYIELEQNDLNSSPADNRVWEIPVLDGFSFSQNMESSEITISEAGATSRRARLLFNDALAPVEWSFSTYARPFTSTGAGTQGFYSTPQVHAVEEPLWAMIMGANRVTAAGIYDNTNATASPSFINAHTTGTSTFNFGSSNVSSFTGRWNIYFAFTPAGGTAQVYLLSEAVVNSATMDFDIEGITTIQWSGFAKSLTDAGTTVPTIDFNEGTTSTSTFIRNRLSTVSLSRTDSPNGPYTIVLTGGSINVENNMTYLTPEELGKVNQPFANITGARSISGNLTAYLDTGADNSAGLLADIVADTTVVRNVYQLIVNVGGTTGNRIVLSLPTAHLEVPAIGVEDLLTLDIAFHGQVSQGNIDSMNEMTIAYRV